MVDIYGSSVFSSDNSTINIDDMIEQIDGEIGDHISKPGVTMERD